MNEAKYSILYGQGWVQVSNDSELELFISLKPKKPKRKVWDIMVVQPNSFLFFEAQARISEYYFSFKEVKNGNS